MTKQVTCDSSAALNYLDTLQSTIGRMASNSARCKTWCVTLVSAILVLVAKGYEQMIISIAFLPTALFMLLDSYYLALEGLFIRQYNSFASLLHEDRAKTVDLFVLRSYRGYGEISLATLKALGSFSVWPFYGVLFLMLEILRRLV